MKKNTFIIPSLLVVGVSITGCMSPNADEGTKVFSSRSEPQSVHETNATLTPLPVNVVPSMAQSPLADAGLIYEESKTATVIKTPVNSEAVKATANNSTVVAKKSNEILVSDKAVAAKAKVNKADRLMTLTNKNVVKAKKNQAELARKVAAKKRADKAVAVAKEKIKADVKKRAKEVAEKQKKVVSRPASTIRKNSKLISSEMAKTKTAAKKTTVKSVAKSAVKKAVASAKKKLPTATLLQEARNAIKAKNFEKAANALERAHRIQPKNAKILYDIAQIRYAQGKYSQAESFAGKAANNSSATLAKKSWTILSKARKAMGNTLGAKTAAKKAASY